MLIDLLYSLAGFALLLWGADRFVAGAAATANMLGVPPILIGLTVVGFATSAPEIMVSISAASEGFTSMAMGNALGSNIANIGLVLGGTALLRPIRGELSATLSKELPLLVLITPLTIILFLDNSIDRLDATLLIGALVIFLLWMIRIGMQLSAQADPVTAEISADIPTDMSKSSAALWIVIGFGSLLIGAELLVTGAVSLAQTFGVSNLVIGLTVVAIGTSLPELAVSLVSAARGDTGIAVGNVIGSNIFNLFAVVGVAGLINPAELELSIAALYYPIMIGFTMPVLLLAYNPFGDKGLGRGAGLTLLAAFIAFQYMVVTQVL